MGASQSYNLTFPLWFGHQRALRHPFDHASGDPGDYDMRL